MDLRIISLLSIVGVITPIVTLNSSNYSVFTIYPIGPIEPFGDLDVIQLEYKLDRDYNRIRESLLTTMYSTGITSLNQKSVHYASAGTLYNKSFSVDTTGSFNEKGMRIKLVVENLDNGEYLHSTDFVLYPIVPITINPLQSSTKWYDTNPISFECSNSLNKVKCSHFEFYELVDYLETDRLHSLVLSNQRFEYYTLFSFTYESAYLKFKDKENLFPFYYKEENGYKIIPLKLKYDGTYITYEYDQKFYYNQNTGQISDYFKNGFFPTNHLYLPKNSAGLLDNYEFNIHIKNIGPEKVSLDYTLNLIDNGNLLGVCKDSDYCVIGGVRE